MAQAYPLTGAGTPSDWCWLDFMVGASAARTHRMQIPVAGTGPLFKPAPFMPGAGTAYLGCLHHLVREPAPEYQRIFELNYRFITFALLMKKKEKANMETRSVFDKMIEDRRAIVKSIRDGKSKETIEKERDVRFATPV